MLYGHGDDGYRSGREIEADFSTNVWYGGEPAGLKEYVSERWGRVSRYPEVMAESLAATIAAHHDVAPEQVLVTNGTTESIYLIAQAFRGRGASIATPTFSEYEDAARLHQHTLRFVPWNELHAEMPVAPGLFFICHPNNPTGAVFNGLADLIRQHPLTLFVIDEAFIHFTVSTQTLIPLVNSLPNVIVLRSLTKAYAIPGLRLGYLVTSPQLMELMVEHKMPWSVNTPAIHAGHFIFAHYDRIRLPLEQLLHARDRFMEQLQGAGILTHPTTTHFFLAETGQGTAAALKKHLLQHHGLLIRDAANFRGLTPAHFRLATLSSASNQLLITALQQWKQPAT